MSLLSIIEGVGNILVGILVGVLGTFAYNWISDFLKEKIINPFIQEDGKVKFMMMPEMW